MAGQWSCLFCDHPRSVLKMPIGIGSNFSFLVPGTSLSGVLRQGLVFSICTKLPPSLHGFLVTLRRSPYHPNQRSLPCSLTVLTISTSCPALLLHPLTIYTISGPSSWPLSATLTSLKSILREHQRNRNEKWAHGWGEEGERETVSFHCKCFRMVKLFNHIFIILWWKWTNSSFLITAEWS